ncbi:hypothetical protein [Leifsonia poae]|nr:hypothetical protein [Leifsonia poae]
MSEPARGSVRTRPSLTLGNPGLGWLAAIAVVGLIVGAIILAIVGSTLSDTTVGDIGEVGDSATAVLISGAPDTGPATWQAIGGWLVQLGTLALIGYLVAYAVLRRLSPAPRPETSGPIDDESPRGGN